MKSVAYRGVTYTVGDEVALDGKAHVIISIFEQGTPLYGHCLLRGTGQPIQLQILTPHVTLTTEKMPRKKK